MFCIHNISDRPQSLHLGDINLIETNAWFDLLSDRNLDDLYQNIELEPYECMWISNYRGEDSGSIPVIF